MHVCEMKNIVLFLKLTGIRLFKQYTVAITIPTSKGRSSYGLFLELNFLSSILIAELKLKERFLPPV